MNELSQDAEISRLLHGIRNGSTIDLFQLTAGSS